MNDLTFRAMIVREQEDGSFTRAIEERTINDLPDNPVTVKVHYSSLNYKDALSATGNKGVTRNYPHTPGIDVAGEVVASDSADFSVGDKVLVICHDLGANTDGGYGQYIRVPAEWISKCPENLSLREAMIYGTAGFTAAMSVQALLDHDVTPDKGEVLVTGATGGVGSVAVGILGKLGYNVVAATGKQDQVEFLKKLGATSIVGREEVTDESKRPMLKGRWAGVVDSVGGSMLVTALKATQYGGSVTCCGLVASPSLNATVFPFILRGINLLGIDAASCDISVRPPLWDKLANEWQLSQLESMVANECTLDTLEPEIQKILQGQQRGRVVVKLL
ncbi:MAG: YhdH/YhfP family quinone oxidoreductase [Chloroflexota bacterium]